MNTRTVVMGIVNVTPDSFSDGGVALEPDRAIARASRLVEDGAHVIDIGAESTRPSHSPVSAQEEWRRLEPVLRELAGNTPVPISVDTSKASIARRALDLGVTIINDVWGGRKDPDMLRVVAEADCQYIWMHNRDRPAETDPVRTLVEETLAGIENCLEAGIRRENLWLDPGIGFGKTYRDNLLILKHLDEYCKLGFPVLLGTSRKSVIGHTLNASPDERLEGSLATVALGVQAGVSGVRVHDVRESALVCLMTEAIVHA